MFLRRRVLRRLLARLLSCRRRLLALPLRAEVWLVSIISVVVLTGLALLPARRLILAPCRTLSTRSACKSWLCRACGHVQCLVIDSSLLCGLVLHLYT